MAASESTPASISGVSPVMVAADAPISSCTTRRTAASTCVRRCVGASEARDCASVLSAAAAAAGVEATTTAARPAASFSSPKRICDASARSCSSSRTSERWTSCTLVATARHAEICCPRQAAYSSSKMPAVPTAVTWRSAIIENALAPIPAPPTSGHCKLHAATPCSLRESACASSHALLTA